MRRLHVTLCALFVSFAVLVSSQSALAEPQKARAATRLAGQAVFSVPGEVDALLSLGDGRVLAAGRFTSIGGQPAPRSLAVLTSSGRIDTSFTVDESLQVERVTAAALQPDGKIVIAGLFYILPGVPRYYLLRIHANGMLDTDFYEWSVNSIVYTVMMDGNKIVLGGNFTQPSARIARLNADGTADPTFTGITSGPDGTVRSIARQSSGKYIIAGDFQQVNGTDQVGLARLNNSGSLDAAFVPGGFRPSTDVAVLANDSVIVGGENICGDNLFAWYTAAGSLNPALNPDPNMLQSITTLLPMSDGGFLVAGWHSAVCFSGNPTAHEAQVWRYAANGSYATMLSFGNESDVLALARLDGQIIAGGQGRPETPEYVGYFDGLALLDPSDQGLERDDLFKPIVGDEAAVTSISAYTNGNLLVGGNFSHVNGLPRYGVARLLANGKLDAGFAPFSEQPGGWSNAVLALPDGRAVVGFADSNLYLLGSTGSQLSDLSAMNHYDRVSVLALQPDGKVLVGSNWGLGVRRLATDFSGEDGNFTAGNANMSVYALAVQSDHTILVGGDFSAFNGSAAPGLVRLYENGGVDTTFTPPVMMLDEYNPASIYTLAPLAGGGVLVGGNLQLAGGSAHPGLVRLSTTGALDSTFNTPADLDTIRSICLQDDGSIWAGGIDTTNFSNPLLLHLDPTGQIDPSFASIFQSGHGEGQVNAVACGSQGVNWAGGEFSLIDGRFNAGLAHYHYGDYYQYFPLSVSLGSE